MINRGFDARGAPIVRIGWHLRPCAASIIIASIIIITGYPDERSPVPHRMGFPAEQVQPHLTRLSDGDGAGDSQDRGGDRL
jgi:hypothetical protein